MIWVKVVIGAVKTLIVLGLIQWVAPDLSYDIGYSLTSLLRGGSGDES